MALLEGRCGHDQVVTSIHGTPHRPLTVTRLFLCRRAVLAMGG
jgi:hypothetical protein